MIITVYNIKGGVGKTRIALNLGLTMGFAIITNETYIPTIQKILSDDRYLQLDDNQDINPILKNVADKDVIFDFGGKIDKRLKNIFKESKWVVVPLTYDYDEIASTIGIVQEIEDYTKKIVFVANRTEKGDYERIKEAIKDHYDYTVFEIKKSRALPNITNEGKSIKDMTINDGLKRHSYKLIVNQFDELIKYLNG